MTVNLTALAPATSHPTWCATPHINCGDHLSDAVIIPATGRFELADNGLLIGRVEVCAKRADESGHGAELVTVSVFTPFDDMSFAEADLTRDAALRLVIDARLLAHDLAGLFVGHSVTASIGRGALTMSLPEAGEPVELTVTDIEDRNGRPTTVALWPADVRALLDAISAVASFPTS